MEKTKRYTVETGYATDWNEQIKSFECHYSDENGEDFDSLKEAEKLFKELVVNNYGKEAVIVQILENLGDGEIAIKKIYETDPKGHEIVDSEYILDGDLENIIRGIERKYQGYKVLVTVKNEDDEELLLNMPSDDVIRYGSLHLLRCEVESFEEFELKEFVTLDVVIDF